MSDGGFRGYIASRPVAGERTPQHVQNLVIRDYARRRHLEYRLSAAEYAMPGCYLMLEQVLSELSEESARSELDSAAQRRSREETKELAGLILYSIFMLPRSAERRERIWQLLLERRAVLHAAVEEIEVSQCDDVERVETLLRLHETMRCTASSASDLDFLRQWCRTD